MPEVSPAKMPPHPQVSGEIAGSHRSWLTKLFSFPVMCVSLLVGVVFAFAPRGIAESDIWWHLRNARNLLQLHSFSVVDTYTFSAAGSPWISFEWLSEVPYYLAFRAMDLQGILLVYSTVVALIFIGVYYRCWRAGANCKDAAVATLGGICLAGVSLAPRTLLFGWLCMEGLLLVLDHFRRTGKGLWLLPPLFAVWINLHGSWVFGMAVLAIVIGSGLVQGEWGLVVAQRWEPRQLRSLLLAGVASVAALFVNPFGYKLVLYPYDLLIRHNDVVQGLEEWQPVNFGGLNGKLALAVVFLLIALPLLSSKRWKLQDVLLASFALWAALSHVRFLFFAGLVIMPILAPRMGLFPPYEAELDKPWLNAGIIVAVAAALIFFFPTEAQLQQKVDQTFPKNALQFMQEHRLDGKTFNQYAWGGYMEWNTPQIKPFIDGRADIFVYNGVFRDFLRATSAEDSFEILNKHGIEYVLLPPESPLAYLLRHSAKWRTVYSDQVSVLFERGREIPAPTNVRAN